MDVTDNQAINFSANPQSVEGTEQSPVERMRTKEAQKNEDLEYFK